MTPSRTLCLGLDRATFRIMVPRGATGALWGHARVPSLHATARWHRKPPISVGGLHGIACMWHRMAHAPQGLSVFQHHPTPLKDWLQRDASQCKPL